MGYYVCDTASAVAEDTPFSSAGRLKS